SSPTIARPSTGAFRRDDIHSATHDPSQGLRESGVQSLFDTPQTSTLSADSAAMRLVAALLGRGVDTFFGIPGGPVCPVFEALRMTPGVTLIESRHESNAAFAAAAFQRATGKTPCVVVTAGPGITNTV